MCEPGNTKPTIVIVPADLSHTGRAQIEVKPVDSCIAPIVAGLVSARIVTRGSCCGHGKGDGEILLDDGRVLVVRSTQPLTPNDPAERERLAGVLRVADAEARAGSIERYETMASFVLARRQWQDENVPQIGAALADSGQLGHTTTGDTCWCVPEVIHVAGGEHR